MRTQMLTTSKKANRVNVCPIGAPLGKILNPEPQPVMLPPLTSPAAYNKSKGKRTSKLVKACNKENTPAALENNRSACKRTVKQNQQFLTPAPTSCPFSHASSMHLDTFIATESVMAPI